MVANSNRQPQLNLRIEDAAIPKHDDASVFQMLSKELKSGDCLVVALNPAGTPKSIQTELETLRTECLTKEVALRVIKIKDEDAKAYVLPDIFWWKTPYNEPRDQENTYYYWNDKFLGMSDKGFSAALDIIKQSKPKKVMLVGSSYPHRFGWSNHERPFSSEQEQQLLDRLEAVQADIEDLVGALLGFYDHH